MFKSTKFPVQLMNKRQRSAYYMDSGFAFEWLDSNAKNGKWKFCWFEWPGSTQLFVMVENIDTDFCHYDCVFVNFVAHMIIIHGKTKNNTSHRSLNKWTEIRERSASRLMWLFYVAMHSKYKNSSLLNHWLANRTVREFQMVLPISTTTITWHALKTYIQTFFLSPSLSLSRARVRFLETTTN